MKKQIIIFALAFTLVGYVFAAGAQETTTVEGLLEVQDSIPFIKSGGTTYVLPQGPFYRFTFNNSIQAGDSIKVEGYVRAAHDNAIGMARNPFWGTNFDNASMLVPSKLWVNGKSIDLTEFVANQREQRGQSLGMHSKHQFSKPGLKGQRGFDNRVPQKNNFFKGR